MKKQEKIKIGYKKQEARTHLVDSNRKIKALNALYEYCEQFISIKDKQAFSKDFYNSFLKGIEDKHRNEFPPAVRLEMILKLLEVDTDKLKKLISEVTTIRVDVNNKTLEPLNKDFNVYAETPQEIERYNDALKVCEGLHVLQDKGFKMQWGNIINATNRIVWYNHEKNRLEPHEQYVKRGNNRYYL